MFASSNSGFRRPLYCESFVINFAISSAYFGPNYHYRPHPRIVCKSAACQRTISHARFMRKLQRKFAPL